MCLSESDSEHAGYRDPGIKAAKWNSAFINFIVHTCVVPSVMCQNTFCEKGLSNGF